MANDRKANKQETVFVTFYARVNQQGRVKIGAALCVGERYANFCLHAKNCVHLAQKLWGK